jgi:hypothetical protein
MLRIKGPSMMRGQMATPLNQKLAPQGGEEM